MSERIQLISPETVARVGAELSGNPETYLPTLRSRWLEGTYFTEFIHPEFQVFRIGRMGFEVPVDQKDKDTFGIKIEALSSFGPETQPEHPTVEEIGYDPIESINIMRAFVASAFFEEAISHGAPIPRTNNGLIDPMPVNKQLIATARATRPGMYLYDGEEFDESWSLKSPAFHQAMVNLRDQLTGYYSARMLGAYSDLPAEYLALMTAPVQQEYHEYLTEYALRTYAMFAPELPNLIEVTNLIANSE